MDKPAGLPVIAGDGSRAKCLLELVTAALRRKNPKARAALVHRIDRDTSGIVVFAKSGEAKRLLMGDWERLVTERRYLALVEGRMEGASGRLDSWLVEAGPSRVRLAEAGERGAKRALTQWKLLASARGFSLVELELETGRRHQIRVQLAGIGHPVAGDERYGARGDPLGRLGLHAASIALENPVSGTAVRVESPCPPEFLALLELPPARGRLSGRDGPPAASRPGARSAAPRARAPAADARRRSPPSKPRGQRKEPPGSARKGRGT